ncbi:hypothetical protein PVAG01_11139 [Phlyctema vagabunda]|uniref:Aminoglycoside phosphotransferase domain-containing protein n=1 Tax=Phlyctema vagabunda TaxID=108571 RepID=A0ABR4P1G3_9HELO
MSTIALWRARESSSIILSLNTQHRFNFLGIRRASYHFVSIPRAAFSNCISRSITRECVRRAQKQFRHRISTKCNSPDDHFFRYTSGRWIWNEEQQLRNRFRRFNVPELQRVAAASVGAQECISMVKMAEGSFNKVFRLVMDNDRVVIARIPNPNAGPPYYTTASEVATMDFARNILEIPVPEVYAWSASADNSVGAEYIIMDEAAGEPAATSLDTMELEDKVAIAKELISIEKRLLSISFSCYGSLYYKESSVKGAMTAEVVGDVSTEIKDRIAKRFVIGPTVERDFWSKERSYMDIDRGAWNNPRDYISAIAHREIAWIKRYAVPTGSDDPLAPSAAQNSPTEHVSLLERYLKATPYLLPTDPDLLTSNLWHKDLHSGNIFLEGNRITSIIDWQNAWAGPLVTQARHPHIIDYQGEVMLKFPESYKSLTDEEKIPIRRQVASSIILHLYENMTARENPRLSKVFRLEHGRTRGEVISFASDSWDDDIIPFRESLIRIERYWKEMGFGLPCPIHFTADELRSHSADAEGWNEVQEFWDSVAGLVDRSGWTPCDRYEDALALFGRLRETGLKVMIGQEREAFEAQTRWADQAANANPEGHR